MTPGLPPADDRELIDPMATRPSGGGPAQPSQRELPQRDPAFDETRATVGDATPPRYDETRAAGTSGSETGLGFDLEIDDWMKRVHDARDGAKLGRVGGYELLEEVGRGGQGIVFRARQLSTGRLVAVKRLLHGGFANAAMRRRFQREVQATTTLKHPNIVTVYSVETADDMPMLVMEWVEGTPLSKWIERRLRGDGSQGRIGIRDVIAVFLKVCDAVQHAHGRGIIHRDLKPNNILVSDDGEPRVLDFGLAKFLIEEPGQVQMTMSSEFVGTPAYASPEQVRGDNSAIDIRTDVYALGLILYEQVTGYLPFVDEPNLAMMLQAVMEKDPPTPRSLVPSLHREIEIILMRAMEKAPDKRYQTVDALAGDLRRYLGGEAILAYPPSPLYQFGKLLRKYRYAFSFAATVFVLAIGFAVYAVVQNVRLQHQIEILESERTSGGVVNEFVLELFRQADQAHAGDGTPSVAAMFDRGAQRVAAEIKRPDSAADIHLLLGAGMSRLMEAEKAETQLRLALAADAVAPFPNLKRTVLILSELAHVLVQRSRFDEARPLLERRLAAARNVYGNRSDEAVIAITTLCDVLERQDDYAALVTELEREAADRSAGRRALDANGLMLVGRLARALNREGRFDEADRWYQRVVGPEAAVGVESLPLLNEWGGMLTRAGKLDQAAAALTRAMNIAAEKLAPTDWRLAALRRDCGIVYHLQGDHDRAIKWLLAALDELTAILGESHDETQAAIRALVDMFESTGKGDQAAEFRELLLRP
ncbi:MAG: protein kinase domain-containing protein [Phycisphaerae bacterium]